MLIGVVGFLDSGKGTVSDVLVEEYSYKKYAFADPLKDAVSVIFGWDRTLLEGDTKESREFREIVDPYWTKKLGWKVTPRKVLQLMGTEGGRNVFGENLWVSALEKRVEVQEKVVIADVRFRNEIAAIQELGGKVVRVKRGSEPEWYELAEKQNKKMIGEPVSITGMQTYYPHIHQSEYDWIGTEFDYLIENEGSLDDLKNNVRKMLNYF